MRFVLVPLIISLAGMALTEDQQQEPLWLAKVKVKCGDTVYNCLGAIVTDEFLITTASCVNKCDDSERVVKILATELPAAGDEPELYDMKLRATEVIVHPQYSTQNMHNVALVKFKCPEFHLAKAALNDSCMPKIKLSVMNLHVDEKSTSCLMSAASLSDKKKKCKRAYSKIWDESMQSCVVASSCSDKSEALIANGQHDTLYGFSLSASQCDNKQENTIIAALELCKYYNWIMNTTITDKQCIKKSTSAPASPPRQIITTQPTTATTATTKPTTTTTPSITTPTKPAGCPVPADIANGEVIYSTVTHGSIAIYNCDQGYVMNGNKRIKCIGTSWNRDPPTCDPKNCGAPPRIPNGQVSSTGQNYGSNATYQCDAGYQMKGDDTITCEKNGQWSRGVPTCKQQVSKSCRNPKPVRNAIIEFDSVQEGSTVKYSCHARYRLAGDSKLACRNGKWDGVLPQCVDCPSFGTVANAKLQVIIKIAIQHIILTKCNEGYTLVGEAINQCIGGKWTHAKATCKINECPVPEDIPIGSVKYTSLTYASIAVYSCPSNYIISGYQQRQCQADKTWTGSPPTCVPKNQLFCKPYDRISCGSTANRGGVSIGATVTYKANTNFQLMGPDVIKCLSNGKWSAPAPGCRAMCPMSYDLENGDHEMIMNDSKPEYTMMMTCDEGYTMVGVKNFTCNKNGLWDRAPSATKCVEKCTCLKVKNSLKVTCTETEYAIAALVQCKRGFKLTGLPIAYCVKSLGRYIRTPSCLRA